MASRKKETLVELAKDLDLSPTTVSLCLSGNPEKYKIKAETIERVRSHAEKRGYVPNSLARRLLKPEQAPIGLLVAQDSSSEKSVEALRDAMRILDQCKRDFMVLNFLPDRISDPVARLKGMGACNIIVFGRFSDYIGKSERYKDKPAEMKRLEALLNGIDMYALDYDFPIPANSRFSCYRMGIDRTRTYVKLLIQLKEHGKGNFMCDAHCRPTQLARYGFDFPPELVLPAPLPPLHQSIAEQGRQLADAVINGIKNSGVKTVLLHNDKSAAGLITELIDRNIKVPEDVGVIGFNNIDLAEYLRVPLTSIALPIRENLELALDSILNGKEIPREIENEAQIIWRKSAKLTK